MAGRTESPEKYPGRIPGQQIRQDRTSFPKVVACVLRHHCSPP